MIDVAKIFVAVVAAQLARAVILAGIMHVKDLRDSKTMNYRASSFLVKVRGCY